MSDECLDCGCTHWEVVNTNGAEYPEPLVETRECVDCGNQWPEVLTA